MRNTSNNNQYRCFKQFRLGLSLFFLGFVVVYCSSQLMQPSLQQELAAALGIGCIAIGFIVAVMAEVRLVLHRLLDFFNDK